MKKSIMRAMYFVVTVTLLFTGCNDSVSPQNAGYVDGFLVRVTQKPGTGTGPELDWREVTVTGGGQGATVDGSYLAGATVTINAGTMTDRPFLKWTTADSGVVFADSASPSTSFKMPPYNVTVTANFDPTFPVTVSGGTGATSNGRYLPGATVNITAGTSAGPFEKWTTADSGVVFADSASPSTSFTMPAKSVKVAAVFTGSYQVKVSSIGTGATGDGYHYVGETVNIYAGTGTGRPFEKWTTASKDVIFADSGKESTSFIMPANDVTVTAVFKASYMVTVSSIGVGATGSSAWVVGTTVPIYAGMTPANLVFKTWTTESDGVIFANANSATTTFKMPANDVEVKAEFKIIPGGDSSLYKKTMIDGKTWLAENLYVETEDSWCYGEDGDSVWIESEEGTWYHYDYEGTDNWRSEQHKVLTPAEIQANCKKHGRLYTWEAAKKGCQLIGWRLPSEEDWNSLITFAGGREIAGSKLKSTSGWMVSCTGSGTDTTCTSQNGTDDYGFSALPGGYRSYDCGPAAGCLRWQPYSGYWWTTREFSGGAYAVCVDGSCSWGAVKLYGLSARCIKDD